MDGWMDGQTYGRMYRFQLYSTGGIRTYVRTSVRLSVPPLGAPLRMDGWMDGQTYGRTYRFPLYSTGLRPLRFPPGPLPKKLKNGLSVYFLCTRSHDIDFKYFVNFSRSS